MLVSPHQLRLKTLPFALACSIAPLLVFGLGGYYLDLALDKSPIFLIIGVVVAFITTVILILSLSKKYAGN